MLKNISAITLLSGLTGLAFAGPGDNDLNGYNATEKEISEQACYSADEGGGNWSDSDSDSSSDAGGLSGAWNALKGGAKAGAKGLEKGLEKGDGC